MSVEPEQDPAEVNDLGGGGRRRHEYDGSMQKVVVFGTGDFAEIAHYYLTNDSAYEVVAFTVDGDFLTMDRKYELPVVPFEAVQGSYPPDGFKMFVAVAQTRMNALRQEKCAAAKGLGYELITYLSSRSSTWPDTQIGSNCFITEHNLIQPFASIGDDVVMWSGNHVGHHVTIGDHCFLTCHVVVASHVTVESHCYLGLNATIGDGITIGRASIVGAGALVMRDTEPREVYLGQRAQRYHLSSDNLPPAFLSTGTRTARRGRVRPAGALPADEAS
jgi:sugar O-acyltransferase (sialic acid O-acetyltransferase NeuD family)